MRKAQSFFEQKAKFEKKNQQTNCLQLTFSGHPDLPLNAI